MKCNNKEAFEQQNVFGTGMPNDRLRPVFHRTSPS